MTQVKKPQRVQPASATKERKVPLSQPGSKNYNQKAMENSKTLYSGTGGKY